MGRDARKNPKRKIRSATVVSTELGMSVLFIKPRANTSPKAHPTTAAAAATATAATTKGFITTTNPALTPAFQHQIFSALVAMHAFPIQQSVSALKAFLQLDFTPSYYKRFTAKELASHCALFTMENVQNKVLNGKAARANFMLAIENNKRLGKNTIGLYLVNATNTQNITAVESQIAKLTASVDVSQNGYSVENFTSKCGQYKLYLVQTGAYSTPQQQPSATIENLDAVKAVAVPEFAHHYAGCPIISSRYTEILHTLSLDPLSPQFAVHPAEAGAETTTVFFAFTTHNPSSQHTTQQFQVMTQLTNHLGLVVNKKSMHTFANNAIVFTITLDLCAVKTGDKLTQLEQQFYNLLSIPTSPTLTPALLTNQINPEQYVYISTVSKILFYAVASSTDDFAALRKQLSGDILSLGKLRSTYLTLRREAITAQRIETTFLKNMALTAELTKDFQLRQSTDFNKPGFNGDANADLIATIKKSVSTVINNIDQEIFLLSVKFNQNVLKSNVYCNNSKQALALRIQGDFFNHMDLPRVPFAVFMVVSPAFQGLHIRFDDVARGGIRLIVSRDNATYSKSKMTQFEETFGLAFTQSLKNKDIPEGGSKGTILLDPNVVPPNQGIPSFERYVNALLDLIIPQQTVSTIDPVTGQATQTLSTKTVIDNYKEPELLFLGPDEGTAGVMSWAAKHAQKRGYSFWRAFTTGKPAQLGGIPHDVYGMTTNSVHRFAVGCLDKLGMKEEEVFKCQTAGPDGDLGSNEIKISKDKTICIVDGSGVLYDPEGIDRPALVELAERRIMSNNFDLKKLSPKGFFISVDDKNVTLPHGEVVSDGFQFRNDFHLHPLFKSELFVPCGGRPQSINLSNVDKMFINGQPKFKIMVEGANLFASPEARLVMADGGMILFKDASTNKGGVTSSSLEVLAALSLPNDTFETQMAVHDKANPPPAYEKYAHEIRDRIIENANMEFECLWSENQRTKTHYFQLTDKVSEKINAFNLEIHQSPLFDDKKVREAVLREYIPKTLQDLVGFETVVETAPESYIKACFTAYLASRFVYTHGYEGTQQQFDEWIANTYHK